MNNISIALTVMNRTDRVFNCLYSWCLHSIFDDIVLVDWSSSSPITENDKIKSLVSSKNNIKIIRVDNEKYKNHNGNNKSKTNKGRTKKRGGIFRLNKYLPENMRMKGIGINRFLSGDSKEIYNNKYY
jgi:hypothetical protein